MHHLIIIICQRIAKLSENAANKLAWTRCSCVLDSTRYISQEEPAADLLKNQISQDVTAMLHI